MSGERDGERAPRRCPSPSPPRGLLASTGSAALAARPLTDGELLKAIRGADKAIRSRYYGVVRQDGIS